MSRIGNRPIDVPVSVKVNIGDGGVVTVQGPKGSLAYILPNGVIAVLDGAAIILSRMGGNRKTRALHGLARALVNNMVVGVSSGFTKELEISGVGFKAAVSGGVLKLNLGFSHDILFRIPDGIKISVADNTKLKIEGVDRQLVGQVAADLRSYYPPEPYKGKGVKYAGERILRKEGKTVQ